MSEKITKLTKKQEAAMSVYVQKWLGIGTNTDRLDPDRTTSIINNTITIISIITTTTIATTARGLLARTKPESRFVSRSILHR